MSRMHTETRTKTTTSSPRLPRLLTRPQAAHPAAIIQRGRCAAASAHDREPGGGSTAG